MSFKNIELNRNVRIVAGVLPFALNKKKKICWPSSFYFVFRFLGFTRWTGGVCDRQEIFFPPDMYIFLSFFSSIYFALFIFFFSPCLSIVICFNDCIVNTPYVHSNLLFIRAVSLYVSLKRIGGWIYAI